MSAAQLRVQKGVSSLSPLLSLLRLGQVVMAETLGRLDRARIASNDEDALSRPYKRPQLQPHHHTRRRYVRPPLVMRRLLMMIGIYKGGQFSFTFAINTNYPHEPPKVLCTQKVRYWYILRQVKNADEGL